MEDMEHGYSNNLLDNFDLEIDEQTTASIKEASKWAKFISILMFCLCGLMLIFLLIASISSGFADGFNSSLEQYGGLLLNSLAFVFGIIIVVILIIVTIYYFLLNFARKAKVAVITESNEELNKGLNSLKIYFIIYAALGLLSISTTAFTLLKYF
jgi:uncharacterized membrane protein